MVQALLALKQLSAVRLSGNDEIRHHSLNDGLVFGDQFHATVEILQGRASPPTQLLAAAPTIIGASETWHA